MPKFLIVAEVIRSVEVFYETEASSHEEAKRKWDKGEVSLEDAAEQRYVDEADEINLRLIINADTGKNKHYD